MNMVLLFSSPIVVFVFILQVFAVTSADADVALEDVNAYDSIIMTPIDSDVDQNIDALIISRWCDDGIIPNIIFTIFPSKDDSGVTIETSPPNLVTVRVCHTCSHFQFLWNTNVSSIATSGGIRIGIPPDQLKSVTVSDGNNAQILDGFTNITELQVSRGGVIRASMTSLISTELHLSNVRGQMYVQTNKPVTSGGVAGGQSWIETPSFNKVRVYENGSELNIKGDVDFGDFGTGVNVGAQLTVTGTIKETISCEKNSTVNAPSCDNVYTDDSSTCNAGPQSVDVDVDVRKLTPNDQTLDGTYNICGDEVSPSPSPLPTSSAPDVALTVLADEDSAITFTPIEFNVTKYQGYHRISIDISCDGKSSSVPNTMFTIFPSKDGNGVTVETSPANLVTVREDEYGDFGFKWNPTIASTATSGAGVRIGYPSSQLKEVWVHDGYNVQIVDGFTNITRVTVEKDSILHASMTSLVSTELELINYGGQMYVETNVPVTVGSVNRGGQSWVKTPSYNDIYVWDDAKLSIIGDVDVRNKFLSSVSDDSQLTVTGTITGTIICDDDSIVNAPSCDNIDSSDDSTCNAGPQNVDVDVNDLSQNSQILNGTCRCVDDGDAMFYSSSFTSLYICSSGGSTISFAIAIAFTTATAVVVTTAMLI